MAIFPKIQSPCPYKANLAAVMDGDMCRMCKRQVVDITGWTDGERVAFLQACETEVCVSYSLPVRRAAVAAAFAVAAIATPMAAAAREDVPAPPPATEAAEPPEGVLEVVVGGIKDPSKVEFTEVAADINAPDLPVVYDDAKAVDAGKAGTPAARPAP